MSSESYRSYPVKGHLFWTAHPSDVDSPKQRSNAYVTGRGSADEAVVVVKLEACEDAVTYLRIKLSKSGSNAGGEGLNTLVRSQISFVTIVSRAANI